MRRLVITVCLRERGRVLLPAERGGRRRRLDAAAVVRALREIAAGRGLGDRVQVCEGCAGGCGRAGPNVDVAVHAAPRPGERADNVALRRRSYVYSLAALGCLAAVIDENLRPPGGRGRRARARDR